MTTIDHKTTASDPSVRERRATDLARYWLTFVVCFSLLIIRGWDRITHAELFAEGLRFMGEVLNDGWWSLFAMKDQALHVAPKLVTMLVVNTVPVAYFPVFTNLACFAVFAAVMASVVRPCYGWIIPSVPARVILALLLTLAPGLIEILGNLAGLHWSLMLWLGLLTLKDPKYPLAAWELLAAAVTVTTSAGSVVFLPVAFLRLVFARGRRASPPYRPALAPPRFSGEVILFTIFLATAAFLASHFFTQNVGATDVPVDVTGRWRGLDRLLPSLGALFSTFYVLHPFLGTGHTSLFLEAAPFYPLVTVCLVLVAVLLWRIGREMDYRFWLIPAWIVSLMLLGVMLSIARYWAFYGIFSYPYWDWWTRYNFVFACTGLFLWFVLLRPLSLTRITHWSTVVLLALTISYVSQANTPTWYAKKSHEDDGYAVQRYGKKRYWSRYSEDLESSIKTGCPPTIEVRGHPRGKWRFIYESPLPTPENCTGKSGKDKNSEKDSESD